MKAIAAVHNRKKYVRPFGAGIFVFSLVGLFLLSATVCHAATVTLSWDPSPDTDLANYRIYQSDTPGGYRFGTHSPDLVASVPAGTETCAIDVSGAVKYFVGTAVDSSDQESLPSNEVSWAMGDGS